ncbi:MAG: GNAT family N-acetyltransferase [Polyangiaceae bacterium]
MLPDWETTAILEEALMGARRSFLALPDLRVVERPGWLQIVTPSFRDGSFNGVSQSVLSSAEADAMIDATVAEYRSLGIAFRWAVAPDSKPDDLAARLAARGLASYPVRAMARSTASFGGALAGGATVEEVDEHDAEVFTQVMAEAWSADPGPLRVANAVVLAERSRRFRLYVARVAGEPAGCASCCMFARSTYMIGAAVLPRFRGAGVYRALVAARLQAAAALGLELATTQALDSTSAPLLEHMGFETVARFVVFRSEPPAA